MLLIDLMMSSTNIYIGVDGGGTKTHVLLLSSTSDILGEGYAGSTNPNSVGEEGAKAHLKQAVDEAFADAKKKGHQVSLSQVSAMVLGMAGCNNAQDSVRMRGWASTLFTDLPTVPHLEAHNDSMAALASGTLGTLHGVVLISGTGMIAFGVNQHTSSRWTAAGNGALIDYGSGYSIGIAVLRACFAATDGMGESTTLLQPLLQQLKINSMEEAVSWLYADHEWARIAALAPLAFQQAKLGDAVSIKIIEQAADYLALSIKAVVSKLKFDQDDKFKIVLAGGTLKNELMFDKLTTLMKQFAPQATITYPVVSPAHGAALLALNATTNKNTSSSSSS